MVHINRLLSLVIRSYSATITCFIYNNTINYYTTYDTNTALRAHKLGYRLLSWSLV